MTRDEQIRQTAAKYAGLALENDKCKCLRWFEKGAYWADQFPKNPWISVEDRLPEDEQVVFCIYNTEKFNGKLRLGVNIATFHTELDGKKNIFVSWDCEIPKYWMPIPELRKEE